MHHSWEHLGILSPWDIVRLDIVLHGFLSLWGFVPLGFCPPGLLSHLDFVPLGFCPHGILSSWVFVFLGFCPLGYCPMGFCPVGFCPRTIEGGYTGCWWSYSSLPLRRPLQYYMNQGYFYQGGQGPLPPLNFDNPRRSKMSCAVRLSVA